MCEIDIASAVKLMQPAYCTQGTEARKIWQTRQAMTYEWYNGREALFVKA
jgi:hypothetical protein